MITCKECGHPRSEVLNVCGGCLAKARGEEPRVALPLSPRDLRIAQTFLGIVSGRRAPTPRRKVK